MKTASIATALYHREWCAFSRYVIPPWIEGFREEEQRIKAVYDNAKEVIKQRDELTALRPAKREEYRQQCEEVVCKLAAKIQDMVSLDNCGNL